MTIRGKMSEKVSGSGVTVAPNLLTRRIDQTLRLVLHPLLVIEFNVFFVLSSRTMSLTDRRLFIRSDRKNGTADCFGQRHETAGQDVTHSYSPSHGSGKCRSSHSNICLWIRTTIGQWTGGQGVPGTYFGIVWTERPSTRGSDGD